MPIDPRRRPIRSTSASLARAHVAVVQERLRGPRLGSRLAAAAAISPPRPSRANGRPRPRAGASEQPRRSPLLVDNSRPRRRPSNPRPSQIQWLPITIRRSVQSSSGNLAPKQLRIARPELRVLPDLERRQSLEEAAAAHRCRVPLRSSGGRRIEASKSHPSRPRASAARAVSAGDERCPSRSTSSKISPSKPTGRSTRVGAERLADHSRCGDPGRQAVAAVFASRGVRRRARARARPCRRPPRRHRLRRGGRVDRELSERLVVVAPVSTSPSASSPLRNSGARGVTARNPGSRPRVVAVLARHTAIFFAG